jgi:hypothetical protein
MTHNMTQLTLRDFDPRLEAEIRRLAAAERISLNRAAQKLMSKGAGLLEPAEPSRRIGSALDRFIGTWTAAEAREIKASTRVLGRVDRDLWK